MYLLAFLSHRKKFQEDRTLFLKLLKQ
jgi:hypothetical protein